MKSIPDCMESTSPSTVMPLTGFTLTLLLFREGHSRANSRGGAVWSVHGLL